ncbi:Protein kinase superfamily protein [Abeliophyllum distichum]|uniref:non-specific serine/threonine protein kinase n=1 Tax=Abeliophyllum distichum TaxID=126358 RepID=A0ABD1QK44_9LAMI
MWVIFRRKSQRTLNKYSLCQIPNVSKDIRVDSVGEQSMHDHPESLILTVNDKSSDKNSEKMLVHLGRSKSSDVDNSSQCSSMYHHERVCSSQSGEEGSSGTARKQSSMSYGLTMASPLIGLPEISHLGWGHWFTLRDLEVATNRFSAENILGEGGYGVVYQGRLVNGTDVAVKKLLNNLGQAEKEFRVEVEAIGHVRHKNLVRLLGYCIEGVHRMLVYEYVNNGNLEQWLHGAMRQHGTLTWEARMKVLLGTAKALAYLHEAIEPKVVHRDIKSSNILIDDEFNAKVSDFGLAKLLGSGESHITTRVMGTFGYVAPEYANTGLLNEKSDVYSFGVLLLEAVTGRDPVDYGRPAVEVNLVEWLKMMVGNRRAEEVVDPNLEKRPKMSQVVRMLEADEFPYREDRRTRKSRTASMEIESMKEGCGSSADQESGVGQSESHTSETNHG